MFLAFQYPEEIAGVPVIQFLRQALSARGGEDLSVLEVRLSMLEWMERLGMDPAFGERYLNEGFSGGEKKRNEILQMAILEPELAVLDETDSGLDIDALRIVADGVQAVRDEPARLGVLLITHYQRILDELRRRRVHVLVDGRIVDRGRPGAGRRLEAEGYDAMAEVTVTNVDTGTDAAGRRPRAAKKDFPLLAARSTATDRLPRLGVVGPAPAVRCSTPWTTYYETTHANVHRGVYTIAEEADRRYEAARVAVGRFIGAPDPEHEIIFTKNATEAINLVAATWGRANLRPRRRRRAHRHGAPRQHRPVAHAGRGAGHRAALDPHRRRLPARPLRPRPAPRRGEAGRPAPRMSNVLGTITPVRPHRRGRPRAGAAGARRRRPVRSPPPDRRGRARMRLPGLQRPQDARPHRDRRAVGPARAARGDAPVPGRRRR